MLPQEDDSQNLPAVCTYPLIDLTKSSDVRVGQFNISIAQMTSGKAGFLSLEISQENIEMQEVELLWKESPLAFTKLNRYNGHQHITYACLQLDDADGHQIFP